MPRLLDAILQSISDVVLVVDDAGAIRWMSPAYARLVGPDRANLVADAHPDDRSALLDALRGEGDPLTEPVRLWSEQHKGWRSLDVSFEDHRADPELGGILVCGRDVTKELDQAEQLRRQAVHDPLTGLPNRALLLDRLQRAASRSSRYGLPFAVLFFDLDHFKGVNDTLGHAAGDALLVEVANRVRGRLRSADTLARLGGDEFVIVLERLRPGNEHGTIDHICADLLAQLDAPIDVGDREVRLTASIGVVISDGDDTAEELLRSADVAMYGAKSAGRGRWLHHTEEMTASARNEFEVRVQIVSALDRGELEVHYQPIVEVETGRQVGVEALARLLGPDGQAIPPSAFIPVSERVGLISRIGDRVLHQAARDLAGSALQLSVNVSGRQLADPDFEVRVMEAVAHSGLAPERLTLEVTESVVLDTRDPNVIRTIHRIRDQGVQFALDDFGRGFSSLERLRNLPVSSLKLDRTFVSGMMTIGSGDLAVVRAVVGIAGSLEIPIIAEGVEDELEWTILQRLGVQYAQGYLFGVPSPDPFAPIPALTNV